MGETIGGAGDECFERVLALHRFGQVVTHPGGCSGRACEVGLSEVEDHLPLVIVDGCGRVDDQPQVELSGPGIGHGVADHPEVTPFDALFHQQAGYGDDQGAVVDLQGVSPDESRLPHCVGDLGADARGTRRPQLDGVGYWHGTSVYGWFPQVVERSGDIARLRVEGCTPRSGLSVPGMPCVDGGARKLAAPFDSRTWGCGKDILAGQTRYGYRRHGRFGARTVPSRRRSGSIWWRPGDVDKPSGGCDVAVPVSEI